MKSFTLIALVLVILCSESLVNCAKSKRKKQTSIIDDILKKAEAVRANTKEEEDREIKATPVDRELDPVKCFPKALCGVSSEVEQISKRKKNGLITEYLVLMKEVSKHPEFLEDIVSTKKGKKKKNSKDVPNDDASDSEEDDEDNESDEEDDEDKNDDIQLVTKNEDKKFNKAYLKEKLEMEKLMEETMIKEQLEKDKPWYNYDERPPPNAWGGGGGRPRPRPSSSSNKPWGYGGNNNGGGERPEGPPPRRQRPGGFRPFFRGDKPSEAQIDYGSNNGGPSLTGGITSFFSNVFGLGDTSLTNAPWFASAARDLSGEVAPGVAVDETREILETAIDIGKAFDKPTQCNEIFNACQYDYTELLYMIDDLRKNVREAAQESKKSKKESTQSSSSKKKKEKNSKAKSEKVPNKYKHKLKEEESGDSSGEVPERYVIPVGPPPSASIVDNISFPNVLSWLGM